MKEKKADGFEIEKDVPFPRSRGGRYRWNKKPKYPFEDMKIGDSFFIKQTPGVSIRKIQSRLAAAGYAHSQKYGIKFAMRTRLKMFDGETGVRVWRVK